MRGLSVMLIKKEKTLQVDKLRAILLLEADVNALAKIIFNTRLMPQLELNQSIPPQIIGAQRGQSAIHSALNQQFFLDICNLRCQDSAIIGADATNCFDRIAHPFASLSCQHFDLPISFIIVMLGVIQNMHMHVRTAHGISH